MVRVKHNPKRGDRDPNPHSHKRDGRVLAWKYLACRSHGKVTDGTNMCGRFKWHRTRWLGEAHQSKILDITCCILHLAKWLSCLRSTTQIRHKIT